MKILPYLLALAAVLLGAVLLYLGELDDSPGLGGIGLILMIVSLVVVVRRALADRRP
ncbi:hypothetical protein [Corynebacterium sp.]|uniref:hypothetical protein n=1 Tax=Corynebacterium sp. TaxID=1720 RepID=UPI0026E0B2FC|nr:hypothetical protein [Corynebacterium sp.]MDO5513397.1 hypothetical protein [Corynebacterium sp.]